MKYTRISNQWQIDCYYNENNQLYSLSAIHKSGIFVFHLKFGEEYKWFDILVSFIDLMNEIVDYFHTKELLK